MTVPQVEMHVRIPQPLRDQLEQLAASEAPRRGVHKLSINWALVHAAEVGVASITGEPLAPGEAASRD